MANVFRGTVGVVLAAVLLSYAPPPAPAPLRAGSLPAVAKGAIGISLPATVDLQPGRLARVAVTADPKAKTIRWINASPEGLDLIESETGRWAIVSAPKAGLYRVFVYSAIDGEPTPASTCLIRVGAGPDPGPNPPGPTPPEPTPPEPTPPGPPAPIPDAGFRVLMVYETATVQKLPPEKSAVLYSKKVRDYLDAKCVMGPDGKTREYRIWDQDVDTAGANPVWQNAMKRARASAPWIVISDGKTGFEGPLPANVDEALKLLKKYGGE